MFAGAGIVRQLQQAFAPPELQFGNFWIQRGRCFKLPRGYGKMTLAFGLHTVRKKLVEPGAIRWRQVAIDQRGKRPAVLEIHRHRV